MMLRSPFPSLGLSFLGCKQGVGARHLCFWEQIFPLRNGDKAGPWGRGGRKERRGLPGGKRMQARGDLGH